MVRSFKCSGVCQARADAAGMLCAPVSGSEQESTQTSTLTWIVSRRRRQTLRLGATAVETTTRDGGRPGSRRCRGTTTTARSSRTTSRTTLI